MAEEKFKSRRAPGPKSRVTGPPAILEVFRVVGPVRVNSFPGHSFYCQVPQTWQPEGTAGWTAVTNFELGRSLLDLGDVPHAYPPPLPRHKA